MAEDTTSWLPLLYSLSKAAAQACGTEHAAALHAANSRGRVNNMESAAPACCSVYLMLASETRCNAAMLLAHANEALLIDAEDYLRQVASKQRLLDPRPHALAEAPPSLLHAVDRLQHSLPLRGFEIEVDDAHAANAYARLFRWAGAHVSRVPVAEEVLCGARGRPGPRDVWVGRDELLSFLHRPPATPQTLPSAAASSTAPPTRGDAESLDESSQPVATDGMDVEPEGPPVDEQRNARTVSFPNATIHMSDAIYAFDVIDGVLCLDPVSAGAQALAGRVSFSAHARNALSPGAGCTRVRLCPSFCRHLLLTQRSHATRAEIERGGNDTGVRPPHEQRHDHRRARHHRGRAGRPT